MRYILSPSTDPTFNLALEQYVFDALPRDTGYFMLWQNRNAIIVGKHQNTDQEVNATFVAQHGIQVVRRLSGGGAVYHDLGNLNFTYIVDATPGRGLDLALFCQPVVQALNQMGVQAQVSGRNDITVDGKKFSGNAQYARQGRVMHHGTILFDSDLSVVSRALTPSAEKLSSKGVASVESRVTNLRPYLGKDVSLGDFQNQLLHAMFQGVEMTPYLLTPQDMDAIIALRQGRYITWDWNYGTSPAGSLEKSHRLEGCGLVQATLDLEGGRIASLAIHGDWFGADDLTPLTQRLLGLPLTYDALAPALAEVEVSDWITGLSNQDFIDLLVG